MNFFLHLKKILIHKFWVCYYCFKCDLYLRGLFHDISKFYPSEFSESVKFYQGDKSPIDKAKEVNGWSSCWVHHENRNDHHFEFWIQRTDDGFRIIDMPFECALEMVCDYLGAARAYLGNSFSFDKEYTWWENKKKVTKTMHPHTVYFVDYVLNSMREEDSAVILNNPNFLRSVYDRYKGPTTPIHIFKVGENS